MAVACLARPARLPARPGSLIAREVELESIGSALDRPGVRLVTRVGGAGVGKTGLGVTAASHFEAVERFAIVSAQKGQPLRAARLLGAAAGLRDAMGAPVAAPDQHAYARAVRNVRAAVP